jgi:protein SDA1
MRSPLAMPETLLKDLIQYKNHRDKGVAIASKSILVLFRILNPKLLPRKDRVWSLFSFRYSFFIIIFI